MGPADMLGDGDDGVFNVRTDIIPLLRRVNYVRSTKYVCSNSSVNILFPVCFMPACILSALYFPPLHHYNKHIGITNK